jgi:pimeloyl-ACP methyl ester carboxylesterase
MGFWVGRLRWWLMPRRLQRGIVASVDKVAAEFSIMDQLSTTLADYAAIAAPTRLIVGGRTRQPARAVIDVLRETVPNAHVRLLPDAGHMSPFTHPQAVGTLITEHVDHCEAS